MAHVIIQKDGRFNVYSTIIDDCLFEESINETELKKWMLEEHGKSQETAINRMIEIAKTQGTSSRLFSTLDSIAECNILAGNGKAIPSNEFIAKYLNVARTIKD